MRVSTPSFDFAAFRREVRRRRVEFARDWALHAPYITEFLERWREPRETRARDAALIREDRHGSDS